MGPTTGLSHALGNANDFRQLTSEIRLQVIANGGPDINRNPSEAKGLITSYIRSEYANGNRNPNALTEAITSRLMGYRLWKPD